MNIKSSKFSLEVRECVVRLVQEHRGEYLSLWTAIGSIVVKMGCVPQALNNGVRKHEVDRGGAAKGAPSISDNGKKPRRAGVKELRRANEILKLASVFLLSRSSTTHPALNACIEPHRYANGFDPICQVFMRWASTLRGTPCLPRGR